MPVTPAESVTCGRDNRVTLSATPPKSRSSSGSLAKLAAIRRASSFVSRSVAERPAMQRYVRNWVISESRLARSK